MSPHDRHPSLADAQLLAVERWSIRCEMLSA